MVKSFIAAKDNRVRSFWLVALFWGALFIAQAQPPSSQTFTGRINSIADEVRVPLQGLRAGDVVSVVARGQQDLDAYIILYDSTLSRVFAQDDDSAGGRDAGLVFTVETDGDYLLSFFSIYGGGSYVLQVNVNDPALLAELGALAPTSTPVTLNTRTVSRGTSAQTFRGRLADEGIVDIRLINVQIGDTIYVYVDGTLDPYVAITRATSDDLLAEDDDSGGGLAAALAYVAESSGDYILYIYAIVGGDYTAHVGINTPNVLTDAGLGDFYSSAAADQTYYLNRDDMREFGGLLPTPESYVMVIMESLREGDTIYAYGRGTGNVDAYLMVTDSAFERMLTSDDDSGGGLDAALMFTVPRGGTYAVILQSIGGTGGFRLAVGVNKPEVLAPIVDVEDLASSPIARFDCATVTLAERPSLSGAVQTREHPTFIIHYTLEGQDATTKAYVDAMYEALVYSLRVHTEELGWALPPSDCAEGGDTRLDVYVMDLDEGVLGYAVNDNMVGDNPNTAVRELYAAYSHLIIDNDMQHYVIKDETIALMQSTVAHEVHHNVQFGYDVNESYYGFYEAGAVWLETLLYPDQTDAIDYKDVLAYPNRCIGSRDKELPLRIYGEWLMLDSLTRDLGRKSYQRLWEHLAVEDGLGGFYNGLEALGTNVETVLKRMAVRNLLRDYALGDLLPPVSVEATVSQHGQTRPLYAGVQQLGVSYVRVLSKGVQTFTINGDFHLELLFVGINNPHATVYELGRRGTVDTRLYDESYLIVVNTARHRSTNDCVFSDWTLTTQNGSGTPFTSPSPETWDASKYPKFSR